MQWCPTHNKLNVENGNSKSPVFLETISPCRASAPLSNTTTNQVPKNDQVWISWDNDAPCRRAQLFPYEDSPIKDTVCF